MAHNPDAALPASASTPVLPPKTNNASDNNQKPSGDTQDDVQAQFHFQIAKCMCDPDKVTKIWAILNRHEDGSILAKLVDKDGRKPLHLAAEKDDEELGRVLVCFGVDVNVEDREPASVLNFVVANNHGNFVRFPVSEGVDEIKVAEKNLTRFKEV
ncbi:hypothetical protein BU25DRAFT_110150 [Macroventuria anomochaeta]|uniref:Uncharacterized protein n=1 Tax=Macroventuria anomochaeta TaxID=301207 RepID=A0ACB6RWU9_9PLEO|nr:uncharacterized protein BU25DRAFT_110150 [Macroventuria anomochaeta]KAF2625737.1 hypothetical protein BU25DRAFT_110150 [Macroventuria anomochaeta]